MKKTTAILIVTVVITSLVSCKQGSSSDKSSISTDSLVIAQGEASFVKNCSGCHNFTQDGIGPQLSGLTVDSSISAEWIRQFIKDPKAVIESGDAKAQTLFMQYKTMMPSFAANGDEEIDAIIAFINTHKEVIKKEEVDPNALKNPIPDTIQLSNLVVDLKLVTQFPASSDSGKKPLTRITKLDYQPASGDKFVLDLRGKLYKLQNDSAVVYMDMKQLRPRFINEPGLATGFGSFAFHPDFFKNGLLYTGHSEPPHTAKADFPLPDTIKSTLQWVVTEWKTTSPGSVPFAGEGRELLRIDMVTGIHGMQELTFNPNAKKGDKDYGLLYIGIGDGGCVENGYGFLAHNKENLWGTIIRIDPSGKNSSNGKYGIPAGNPYANSVNKEAREIYAYGFRNPHRITWSRSGKMLACNIGQTHIESVNDILPGHDYGWPIREGNFVLNPVKSMDNLYPLSADDSSFHITYPVVQYDHDEGKAISGGFEYTGNAIPSLKGKYLFGDIPSGRLFYVNMNEIKQGKTAIIHEWKASVNGSVKTFSQFLNNERADLHFGKDSKGEIYIMTKRDGKLYKITSAHTN